jgi:hypothetical protein
MTDLALRSDEGMNIGSADTVPGEVVRKLVAWSEREIDRLSKELELALMEAEAAERQVAQQPAAADLGAAAGHPPMPAGSTGAGVQPAPVGVNPGTAGQLAPVGPHAGAGGQPWLVGLDTGANQQPSPMDITQVVPVTPAAPAPEEAQPPPAARRSATGTAARTTVVRRDSPATQATEPDLAEGASSEDDQVSPTRSEMVRRPGRRTSLGGRLRDHWMMVAGIAVTLVGLVLLLLG